MTDDINLRDIADSITSSKGSVKGEVFRTHEIYIRYREGEEGVKKVEEKLAELGHPFVFQNVNTSGFYKEALSALVILTAKEIFNWTQDDLFEMGNFSPKHSFIVKVFVKHFLSIRDVFDKAEQYWGKHYDFGYLEKGEFDESKKSIKIRIKEFKTHPLISGPYFRGYIMRIAQFSLKSKNIEVQKNNCSSGESDCHEYTVTWS